VPVAGVRGAVRAIATPRAGDAAHTGEWAGVVPGATGGQDEDTSGRS